MTVLGIYPAMPGEKILVGSAFPAKIPAAAPQLTMALPLILPPVFSKETPGQKMLVGSALNRPER